MIWRLQEDRKLSPGYIMKCKSYIPVYTGKNKGIVFEKIGNALQ